MTLPRGAAVALLAVGMASTSSPAPRAQAPGHSAVISGGSLQALRAASTLTDAMVRSGELRVRQTRDDTLLAGRVIERLDQFYRGVRVVGGDVARQLDATGVVRGVLGNLYDGIDIGVDPAVSADDARARVAGLAGYPQSEAVQPELVVLPLAVDGPPAIAAPNAAARFRLAWRVRAVTAAADIIQYYLDAASGDVLLQYSDKQTQAAVGTETGVLGDTKKISVTRSGTSFLARDLLRPPLVQTEDLKGDSIRATNYLDGLLSLNAADTAASASNQWTDGAVGDAQVYAGYTYDYYFKRFGRHGLDNNNIAMSNIANPASIANFSLAVFNQFPDFFVNAFYAGNGVMVFGVGLPSNATLLGQHWQSTSGALDIVGHELSHGVTAYTSNLIYLNESGALNEAFSDMMGTSIEFFFQPAGDGPLHADYEMGEDVITPGGLRSLDNPGLHGEPDHYSKRLLDSKDNGEVHHNSLIASHAFYLSIEGGTNRTSGLAVQGVGAAHRDQIEKVFYRAFTQLMPANSTFSIARAATIQAARDLFGAGSPAEAAVTQAWTAVGVA